MAYRGDGWAALGDPTRWAVFERLAERPQAVSELANELPVSRPAVSQHLKVLKEAGLVIDRAVGNRRIYQLNPDGVGALRAQLDRFWTQALAAFKEVVEQPSEEDFMVTQPKSTTVQLQVVVEAPVERAFSIFTREFDRIKPREHNLLAVSIAETVFEPRVGGRIYDRGVDGSECVWARVLAYDPPNRVVFSWDISPRWQLETNPEKTSEVEVRFIPETEQRTRVELQHRNLDRHGEGWETLRDGVAGGWPQYLQRYTALLSG